MIFPKGGILAALRLPFDAEGNLMEAALANHIEWLKQCGIHGVLALGSTAEFPMLTLKQRCHVLEVVARLCNPLPVIANISDHRPEVIRALGHEVRRLGLPGAAIMPPIFYPASDADQLAHFLHAAEHAGSSMMLYNFPELTGNRISPGTIAAFADRAPMAGIKQSGGEFSYHEELISLGRDKGYAVFSGSDLRLPEVFAMGAAGCIGGLVNIVPELMVQQYRAHCAGEHPDPEIIDRMQQVGKLMDRVTFPENVPAGMAARGFEPGGFRRILSRQTLEAVSALTDDLRRLFITWHLPTDGTYTSGRVSSERHVRSS
jgi:4-hydroxy-tetrahydrodipicolinate synthase